MKNILGLMLIAGLTLSIVACSDNSGTAASGDIDVSASPTNVNYTNTRTIRAFAGGFQAAYTDCDSVGGVEENWGDTTLYKVENGKLFTWSKNSCTSNIATGTSKTLIGTWTLNTDTAWVKGANPNTCDSSHASSMTYTGTGTFTSTSVKTNVTYQNYCWADDYTDTSYSSRKDSVVKIACNQYTKLIKGKRGTYTLLSENHTTGASSVSLTYNTITCTRTNFASQEPGVATCKAAYAAYVSDTSTYKSRHFSSYQYLDAPEDAANAKAYSACLVTAGLTSEY